MGGSIRVIINNRHRQQDMAQADQDIAAREKQYVATLQKRARKIREWLKDHDDKPGKTGKPKKSNITDNESAKMKTSHGVIQGYDGVTTVDGKLRRSYSVRSSLSSPRNSQVSIEHQSESISSRSIGLAS